MLFLRKEDVEITGGKLPVTLWEHEKKYLILIDGVPWATIEKRHHAVVLFEMIKDHITEYMCFEVLNNGE